MESRKYFDVDDNQGIYFGKEGFPYRIPEGLIHAANAAIDLQRPLLITGEPGCGKTDFAFAAARYLHAAGAQWNPMDPEYGLLQYYVRSDSKAKDLLYTYDVVRRFGDAYLRSGATSGYAEELHKQARDPRCYVQLQALGRALTSTKRRVLLIDEVDKAPRDLPNDLLRELDHQTFEIAEIEDGLETKEGFEEPVYDRGVLLRRQMGPPLEQNRPFVVLTSNAERPLPDAFLRRCVFFHLEFPEDNQLMDILVGKFGDGSDLPGEVQAPIKDSYHNLDRNEQIRRFERAIVVFRALRRMPRMSKRPSTSELLDWAKLLVKPTAQVKALFDLSINDGVLANPKEKTWMPGSWRFLRQVSGASFCLVKLPEDMRILRLIG